MPKTKPAAAERPKKKEFDHYHATRAELQEHHRKMTAGKSRRSSEKDRSDAGEENDLEVETTSEENADS